MNDQSQIEAKIIHLTPPQRFQVAHQLPKECPAVPNPVSSPPKSEEYKSVTTNHSKIWAIRILNGTWLLVTLFLKRCTRIDKNLLVVYVALVLLLLQVFMVISRAEAGSLNSRPPLKTNYSNLIADRQHTRIAPTLTPFGNRQFTSYAQAIDRSPLTLAKNPPWQLRLAPTCPGTHDKAAGAAAALFAYFFQLQGKSMTRGSETNNLAPELTFKQNDPIEVSFMLAYSFPISTLIRKESMPRGSDNENPGSALKVALPRKLTPECLSDTGVPQMITSTGSLT